jgi:hypothetical protein
MMRKRNIATVEIANQKRTGMKRKEQAVTQPQINGRVSNTAKEKAYALAFGMINTALEKGCPLQAITIEESILTDRLSSTLNAKKEKKTPCSTLNRALKEWANQLKSGESLFDEKMSALRPSLYAWWDERNELLHGIVKSPCGEGPTIPAEDFLERAEKAAREGLDLARKVVRWTQKQVRLARQANLLRE